LLAQGLRTERALNRTLRRLQSAFRLFVLREPALVQAMRWRRDQGDLRLRLDYPLDRDSVVVDVGGYHGDFAEQMDRKFGSRIFLFEPVPEFFALCCRRFADRPNVRCLNYGLSAAAGRFPITEESDGSSLAKHASSASRQWVEVRRFADVVDALAIERIDLLKVNIEGGEFELLPHLIETGLIRRVRYLQVQFHTFVDAAAARRAHIREQLQRTHELMWDYPFVWESWRSRQWPAGAPQ
jgi:FkbM family methyltransferase